MPSNLLEKTSCWSHSESATSLVFRSRVRNGSRRYGTDFEACDGPLNENMDKFEKLWPDTLSTSEALRDLDYEPDVTLPAMVAGVLNTHSSHRLTSKAAF